MHAILKPSLILLVFPIALAFSLPLIFPSLTFYSWISPELYQEIFREGGLSIELAIPIGASFSMIFTPIQIFTIDLALKYGRAGSEQFMSTPSQFLRILYLVLYRLLYVNILILVASTIISYSIPEEVRSSTYGWPLSNDHLYLLQNMLIVTIYFLLVQLYFSGYFGRDFHFIMAQKWMSEAKLKTNPIEKIKYLIAGVSSYNRYLNRNLGLQFDDTRVSSSIICSSSDKNQLLDTIEKSFNDNSDDKLKPASSLSAIANVPQEQFLRAKRLSTKIKEILTQLGPIFRHSFEAFSYSALRLDFAFAASF